MKDAFKRVKEAFAAIAAVMKIGDITERREKLGKLPAYRSRGKGRGTPSRFFGNRTGVTYPHDSAREMARNLRHRYAEHPRAVKLIHERRS